MGAIREAAIPESLRGFNEDALEGKGLLASTVLAIAQTVPMMAERRVVLVRNVSAMAAGELAGLIEYLENPNPSTVLVCVAGKIDKRIKFFSVAKRAGFLYELEAPRQLATWLRGEAKQQGVTISQAACSRLADVVGRDLSRLAGGLEQLALYTKGREITAEDVDDLVADTRERSVFELTDALGQGDRKRCQRAVLALCAQRQSAVGVVMMLARHVRQLGMCHVALAQRVKRNEIPKLVGAPPFVVDKLMRQARSYPPHAVAAGLAKLSQADQALKGMRTGTKILGRDLTAEIILGELVGDLIDLGTGGRI